MLRFSRARMPRSAIMRRSSTPFRSAPSVPSPRVSSSRLFLKELCAQSAHPDTMASGSDIVGRTVRRPRTRAGWDRSRDDSSSADPCRASASRTLPSEEEIATLTSHESVRQAESRRSRRRETYSVDVRTTSSSNRGASPGVAVHDWRIFPRPMANVLTTAETALRDASVRALRADSPSCPNESRARVNKSHGRYNRRVSGALDLLPGPGMRCAAQYFMWKTTASSDDAPRAAMRSSAALCGSRRRRATAVLPRQKVRVLRHVLFRFRRRFVGLSFATSSTRKRCAVTSCVRRWRRRSSSAPPRSGSSRPGDTAESRGAGTRYTRLVRW